MMSRVKLVLASSSRYREYHLRQLEIPFITRQPDVDESPLSGETPENTAKRLAGKKAQDVRERFELEEGLIIGTAQVASLDGKEPLAKPRTIEGTIRQLSAVQGQWIIYYTGLCLLNAATGRIQTAVAPVEAKIRPLSLWDIEHYAKEERPFECAGSVRLRGRGIALVESIIGPDPSAAEGLPLITLINMLLAEGHTLSSLVFPDRRRYG